MATILLSRPLKTHKGELTALELREICGGDLLDFGEPVSVERTTRADRNNPDVISVSMSAKRDMALFGRYAERLTGLNRIDLAALPLQDFRKLVEAIEAQFEEGGDSPLPQPPASSPTPA